MIGEDETEKPFLFEDLFSNNRPLQKHHNNSRFSTNIYRGGVKFFFDRLKAAKYLHPDNTLEDWLYWFGHGDEEAGRTKIHWMGRVKETGLHDQHAV